MKAYVTNLKNANVVIRETEGETLVIINDKLMLSFSETPEPIPMEKTKDGFKLSDKSTTTHYKQEGPGSFYIHREDGPAVVAEDFEDYRWYYEGKWIKGLKKKEATPEEYSMYVFEQFMKKES